MSVLNGLIHILFGCRLTLRGRWLQMSPTATFWRFLLKNVNMIGKRTAWGQRKLDPKRVPLDPPLRSRNSSRNEDPEVLMPLSRDIPSNIHQLLPCGYWICLNPGSIKVRRLLLQCFPNQWPWNQWSYPNWPLRTIKCTFNGTNMVRDSVPFLLCWSICNSKTSDRDVQSHPTDILRTELHGPREKGPGTQPSHGDSMVILLWFPHHQTFRHVAKIIFAQTPESPLRGKQWRVTRIQTWRFRECKCLYTCDTKSVGSFLFCCFPERGMPSGDSQPHFTPCFVLETMSWS